MALLTVGHGCADMCQATVPALLPFLVSQRDYSLTGASALVLAAMVSSSLLQPALGHLSDRRSLAPLMPWGLVVAGVSLAALGVLEDPTAVFIAVVISGIGVAAFHPEASRYANYVSGSRRASGMSVFSAGGNFGLILGPVLATPAVLLLGLEGIILVGTIPVAWGLLLLSRLPYLTGFRTPARPEDGPPERDRWGLFARLTVLVAVRSVVIAGMLTFLPLFFVQALGRSAAEANVALTLMLTAGAVGTLAAGRLADIHGRRIVLAVTLALLSPLIWTFSVAGPAIALALAAPIGAAAIATISLTVVMAQEYLPAQLGVASGVTLGLGIGFGGMMAPLLGAFAEHEGLVSLMGFLAVLPVAAALLALTLRDV